MTVDVHPYDRHVGRYGQQLAAGLIELADVARGDRVLDVGCGTGQLTTHLAAAVGPENVAAIDPSRDFIELCHSRVPEADVRVGGAEALPFADAGFDAVLAQLVVNLVDDPPAAVREMARVARPGAPVVGCVWDDNEMPLLRSFWDAVRSVAPEALAGVSDQAQVGLDDVDRLKQWWAGARLRDVSLGDLEVAAHYDDFDDLWFSFESGVGYSGRVQLGLGKRQRDAVRADAYRRLGSPESSFRLIAKARTVRGVR